MNMTREEDYTNYWLDPDDILEVIIIQKYRRGYLSRKRYDDDDDDDKYNYYKSIKDFEESIARVKEDNRRHEEFKRLHNPKIIKLKKYCIAELHKELKIQRKYYLRHTWADFRRSGNISKYHLLNVSNF